MSCDALGTDKWKGEQGTLRGSDDLLLGPRHFKWRKWRTQDVRTNGKEGKKTKKNVNIPTESNEKEPTNYLCKLPFVLIALRKLKEETW